MNADREEQEDELLALQSIFDAEEFVRDESKFAGEIRVCVELPADFTVLLKEGESQRQYKISYLPPLHLTFELPEDYPSSSPPSFTLTCSWLTHTQLSALTTQLNDLYQATGGAVVLFTWIQFLKEDALGFLDISSLLELPSDEVSNLSQLSSGEKHQTGDFASDQDPQPSKVSSEDPQEAEELGRNSPVSHYSSATQSGPNSESDEEGSEDQRLETSGLKAVSEDDHEDTVNGGDSSASLLPSSNSPQPQDPCGPASVLVHSKESTHKDNQKPSGPSLTPSQALLSQILIYNAAQKQKEFSTTVFDCGVCFVGWLGSDCVQLFECGHIFCRGCLGGFFKLQITEGNIRGVRCPDGDCTATPTPAQVQSLVGEELFSRYDRLLLQMTLDRMADVVYCPRRTCAAACIMEKSSRAAMCSVCDFAFCVACKKTYHGTDKCQNEKRKDEESEHSQNTALPRTIEGLKALWADYSKGSKERKKLLESRYGRSRVQFTVQEGLSEQWIVVNSKNCPHCFCKIEKHGGCNMMTCAQCHQYFCWACLSAVPWGRSGSHYSQSPDCLLSL
ncbi:E3 ubiquitin-protein ligase RNF14-like [Xyrichtys novacula]|uniref:RBR-type E3 ubiquitin transferase n=1 Tax=Xyrichtys novacula TaxID=13765 RepID=A0AAV1FI09_XYRNO|nr:E3 ubiquitin-protein ligase RNF14-like [Xyrichtys novacula]